MKRNADGSIERYKACYVAKGYSQRPGFDFTETFSPTAKWAAIHTVLAIAAVEDLELWNVDVSSAFLNGDLDEEVYMAEPEGFQTKDKSYSHHPVHCTSKFPVDFNASLIHLSSRKVCHNVNDIFKSMHYEFGMIP